MQIVTLPLARCVQIYAASVVIAGSTVVTLAPLALPSKLGCAIAVIVSGVATWLSYLRRRPIELQADAEGELQCLLADGRQVRVARIVAGVVGPALVSATLKGEGGEHVTLFVPGCSMDSLTHWELRRAVIAFRPIDNGGDASHRPDSVV